MFTSLDPVKCAFVVFCIFMGAGYSLAGSPAREALPWWARLFRQLVSVLFISIIAIFTLETGQYNIYLVGLSGGLAGIWADRVLRMFDNFISKEDSLLEFISRCADLIGRFSSGLEAFYKAITIKPPKEED